MREVDCGQSHRFDIRRLQSSPLAYEPLMYCEPLPPPRASGLPRWSALNPAEIGKILLRP